MSRHDDVLRLRDMVQYARLVIASASNRTRADLNRDPLFRAGCERFIEIVGEAAAHVSPATRADLPFIPWHEVVATRNIIVHGYSLVDLDVIWGVIRMDLPQIITMIEGLIGPVVLDP